VITPFPGFATGVLHWIHKHGKSTGKLYTIKLALSIGHAGGKIVFG